MLTEDQQNELAQLREQAAGLMGQMQPYQAAIAVLQSLIVSETLIDGVHAPPQPATNDNAALQLVWKCDVAGSALVLNAYISAVGAVLPALQDQLDSVNAQIAGINASA